MMSFERIVRVDRHGLLPYQDAGAHSGEAEQHSGVKPNRIPGLPEH
jgi:hypothetical protein